MKKPMVSKFGTFKHGSPSRSVKEEKRTYLRQQQGHPLSRRKPSMPQMPWDKNEEAKQDQK